MDVLWPCWRIQIEIRMNHNDTLNEQCILCLNDEAGKIFVLHSGKFIVPAGYGWCIAQCLGWKEKRINVEITGITSRYGICR